MSRFSRFVARALLAEIQRIADRTSEDVLTDGEFARHVLARVIGFLEASIPSAEWNTCDPFRVRRGGRLVPAVVQNARPGDELIACPWCGEPIAINAAVQRIGHELPVCPSFRLEMQKQPTFFDAADFLASRKVCA